MSTLLTNLLTDVGLPTVLPTNEAAAAINRAPQTLRKWASLENGPIRPIRINRRLAWLVSDLQALLEGSPPVVPSVGRGGNRG
jgi:hypothetical protein